MRIGILGSGLMGAKLGTIFARAGHRVVFSYSRDARKLERLARAAGARASAGTPADAARDADALVLAVHWSRVRDVLRRAGDIDDKVIVTCCLPMNAGGTKFAIGGSWSGAEELAKRYPKSRVVGAFGTLPSEVFYRVYANRRREPRPDLLYYGDDARAKRVAVRLIRDAGYSPLDAGPLRMARYAEPFTMLISQLAYESGRSPALAYRFEHHVELAGPRAPRISRRRP